MTPELENRAKQIFEENFKRIHGVSEQAVKGFAESNIPLYEIIINSIVQGMNEGEYKKHLEQSKKDFDSAMEELSEDRERRRLDSETTPVSAENAQVQVAENSSDTELSKQATNKIYSFVSALNTPESKIQPGQKLKVGDYIRLGKFSADQQIKDIFDICGFDTSGYVSYRLTGQIVCVGERILTSHGTPKIQYTFSDFKQLCINTFQQ